MLKYRKRAQNHLADFGSGHPVQEAPSLEDVLEAERAQINCLNAPRELNLELIRQETLHKGHPGIVKTKLVARQYVFWPKMAAKIL